MASSLKRGSDQQGEGEVVVDVASGLLGGHAGHGVADGDALVEGGEDAELDPAAQGGLADEEAGQRAGGVEVVVGEHADGFELGGFEHVGFVHLCRIRHRKAYADPATMPIPGPGAPPGGCPAGSGWRKVSA